MKRTRTMLVKNKAAAMLQVAACINADTNVLAYINVSAKADEKGTWFVAIAASDVFPRVLDESDILDGFEENKPLFS